MRKRSLAVATALTLGVLATACSSSDDGPSTVHGIAVLNMDQHGRTVQVFDPASGKVVLTQHFAIGQNRQTLANCGDSGVLSAFSPDYKQMPVRQAEGSGWHVGLLDGTDEPGKSGKFNDLSGDTEGKGKPVTQSTGTFGPDGKLYTIQFGIAPVLKAIDPSSGESKNVGADLSWTEQDESGGEVKKAADSSNTKPYFLPRGEKVEVEPRGHKVYSADGKWAFDMPDDAHLSRGNLQTPSGEHYTVPMPKQADGSVDSMVPVVVQDQATGLFMSYGDGTFYRVKFGRETATSTPVNVGAPKNAHIDATGSPDGKSFAFIATSDDGNSTLSVADTKAPKPKRLTKLKRAGFRSCLIGWR